MVAHRVSDLLRDKVSLELEGIDRLYINGYVPGLQTPGMLVGFIRNHLKKTVLSTSSIEPMTRAFLQAIEAFVEREGVDLVNFKRGQRKDDIAQDYLSRFKGEEGVLFVGRAQEKVSVFSTEKRRDPRGHTYPWIVRTRRIPNHYYFYVLDRDFGPLFIKICSYFPYAVKVCLNGNEWLKRQLHNRSISYEALDNGILSCEDPKRVQSISRGLSPAKIDKVVRKWFARLPHPFSARDRRAGYRYQLSVLQAEFALTQVLDRPATGRAFFEEVIRENIDLGRPEYVQLVFQRKITRRTPGFFRTRIITNGVVPSLYVQYKRTVIKQYHKLGRALRTETTINEASDFGIGKRLHNLPALAEIGYQANRRLLDVQSLTHDCTVGAECFDSVVRPVARDGQRASALHFGDPRAMALLQATLMFVHLPDGFSNRTLRERFAHLLDREPAQLTPGQMTYDLRRLRLHGLIERIPRTYRYRLTQQGVRVSLFFSRTYARLLRPVLSVTQPGPPPRSRDKLLPPPLQRLQDTFDELIRRCAITPA